jgi:hypothetical protein
MAERNRTRNASAIAGLTCPALIAWATLLSGCAGSLDLSSVPSFTIPKLTGEPSANDVVRSPVSVAETYIRVARGANKCWFGPKGAYRDAYVFYADAETAAKGNVAEIVIHERNRDSERPWGLKTLKLNITPLEQQADVAIVNLKMKDADANRMAGDVQRWIKGDEGCGEVTPPSLPPAIQAPQTTATLRKRA